MELQLRSRPLLCLFAHQANNECHLIANRIGQTVFHAEIRALDRENRLAADNWLFVHRVRALTVESEHRVHTFGNAEHRQFARKFVDALFVGLSFGTTALERDFWKLDCVEKVRAFEVIVPLRDAGVDAARGNFEVELGRSGHRPCF